MRVFHGNSNDLVYWIIQGLIWWHFIFYTSITLSFIFACRPRVKVQDPDIPGICSNKIALSIAALMINFASAFSILLLPVLAVWKLKMTIKCKMAIAAIFGVGLL